MTWTAAKIIKIGLCFEAKSGTFLKHGVYVDSCLKLKPTANE